MWRSRKSGRLMLVAGVLWALVALGCASVPSSGIDPTGERIFVAPPTSPPPANMAGERYFDEPLGQLPWDDAAVLLQPRETVAAVGSEVVLIAGVCGPDGYLRTNRRLEWSIDPGSVGQFVAVGQTGLVDLLLGDFNRPRKITNTFAIGSTLRSNTRLNRGACKPEDYAYVLRGQGWITLTSAVEGTSNVTVFAPEVYGWDARLKSAMVHWVDAAVPVSAAGDQSGRHEARLHHHGDAAVEPVAVRRLAGAVRDHRRTAGRFFSRRGPGDRGAHRLRRSGQRRDLPEAAGARHEQGLHPGDPAAGAARRRRPAAGRRQRARR